MSLVGKVAIVTGGAQGIGLSTVRSLLQEGAKFSIYESQDILSQACTELSKEFPSDNILPFECDVSNKEQFTKSFLITKEKFGSVDILVNNAGIASTNDWEKVLAVNMHAPMHGTYTAVEYMSPQKGGRGGVIINVASMAAFYPIPGDSSYSVSKAGLVSFTRSMKTLQSTVSVRINCICPVIVETPLACIGSGPGINANDKGVFECSQNVIDIQGGFLSPEFVAEGIMKLITDTSLNGAVMKVNPKRGHYFQEFLSYDEEFTATV